MSSAIAPSRLASRAARPFTLCLAGALALGACSGDHPTAPVAPSGGSDTQIAYTSVANGQPATALMDGDGRDKHFVGSMATGDEAPVLSPDGRRIAVTGAMFGLPQVFVMGTDGSGRVAVTSLESGALLASWSPDGKQLLFNGQDAKTYMVNADGTGLRLITIDTLDEQLPVLSPDGQKIVYMTERNSTDSLAIVELYVMNADGSHPVRLTTTTGMTSLAINMFPAWSPDSRQIAFIRAVDDAPPHVWIVNADGSAPHQVLSDGGGEHSVTWSPDGQRIAFARRATATSRFDIYVANVDGSNVADLTNTATADEIFPNWGRKP